MKEKRVNQRRNRKRHRKVWIIFVLLVILAGIGWFSRERLLGMLFPVRLDTPMVVWDEAEDVYEPEELILFADRNEFQMGEQGAVKLTVLCQESVTEPVTITDNTGYEVAVLENDGSGQLVTTVWLQSQEPRSGWLKASSGGAESAPVSYYVIPEITQEMADRLVEVSTDLGDYVEEAEFEDPLSEEALDAVQSWLEEDNRVLEVKPAGEGLLYATTDNLIGSYGLSRVTPNTFGYVSADEAFEADQAGESLSGLYIASEIPRTNTDLLHISPIPDDYAVKYCSDAFRDSEEKLLDRVGGNLDWMEAEHAIQMLANGDIADYGMTVINTHGSLIERSDGSSMLLMNMGERTRDEVDELMELLEYTARQRSAASYTSGNIKNVWGLLDDTSTLRWILDVTINPEGEAKYVLKMSSNYLESALGDRVFDNTIVYFAVCYARADDQMVKMLHRHGASAFIGCREDLDVGVAAAFLEQMAEVMGLPANEYSFGALIHVSGNVLTSVDEMVKTSVYPDKEGYEGYRQALKEKPLRYSFLNDGGNRVFAGFGEVQGHVLDQDLKEIQEAQVTLYQWLNHEFEEVWSGETGEDGGFLAEEVPYGVYGILAEKDGNKGFVTALVDDGSEMLEADDIILGWTGAENNGGNVVGYRGNYYYWKYNSQSVAPDGLFAYYPYVQETANQLICRSEDGSEQVLLEAKGNGPIFIVGDRIYLEEDGVNLFSVNLEGGDRVEHGAFEPWAADDAAGTLMGSMGYGSDGGIYLLYAKDHSTQQVAAGSGTFLGAEEGYCYYATSDAQSIPSASLWKASMDGSQVMELSRVTSDSEWHSLGISILEMMKSGDQIYYSYGAYAGTGGFFQSGGINCVDTEGTNTQVCVANGELGAEEFLISQGSGGETKIYYVGKDDAIGSYIGFWDDYPYQNFHVKTLGAGGEEQTETQEAGRFYLSRPGSYICVGGEILRYNVELLTYQTLIPSTAGFGFVDAPAGSEDQIVLLSSLDVVGENVFFTVEWSARNKSRDIGWRAGYDRERSAMYVMKMGDTQAAEIYEY